MNRMAFLLIPFALMLASCNSQPNAGNNYIKITGGAVSKNVTNGTAYDKGFLDASNIQTVKVPFYASVVIGSSSTVMEVYMKKNLAFWGHPPSIISPSIARKYMGCGFQIKDEELTLLPYGEWGSMEGGAGMDLLFSVPKRINVERIEKYVLPEEGCTAAGFFDMSGGMQDYWYNTGSPDVDWKKLETVPGIYPGK